METTQTDFAVLEREINSCLSRARDAIMESPDQVAKYQAMFDRTGQTGFYDEEGPIRGEGEQPTWEPNPAYMKSLEAIWDPADSGDDWPSSEELLGRAGLRLERSLYELFFDSREYEDTDHTHRRVFAGHVIDASSGTPVTFFMLTIPHSHQRFELSTAPVIALSKPITG